MAGPSTFLLSRIHRSDCEKSSPKFNRLNNVFFIDRPTSYQRIRRCCPKIIQVFCSS